MLFKNKKRIKEVINQNNELIWANIFHDSIRGNESLINLPLNIGRWAGNYSFFYILNRILKDYKPNSILELGLGESTKFISTYISNYLVNTKHVVVEHDEVWIKIFEENFKLSKNSEIVKCNLEEIQIKGFKSLAYAQLEIKIEQNFDLYIIDGPFGSDRFSRYNIVKLIENFDKNSEFIILLDDFERKGEKDTAKEIIEKLKSKNIAFHKAEYSGIKSQQIIVSEKYKFATSF